MHITTLPARLRVSLMSLALVACAPAGDSSASASATTGGKLLYVFAGFVSDSTTAHTHGATASGAPADTSQPSDFVAVIDTDSASATYGHVIAWAPTGARGSMPHHTEMVMPDSAWPFAANAYLANTTYLVDVANPRAPRIAGRMDSVPGFRYPHSFARLPNGDLVGTYQYGDKRTPGDPGAIARFTRDGRLVSVSSSADSTFAGKELRTYSLDVHPRADRVLTTSVPMDPAETTSADVVQLWRLSDLKLLQTLPLPPSTSDSSSRYPFEVRFLADGRSALLNTYYCGFYLLSALDQPRAKVERIPSLSNPRHIGCAVPLLLGRWWIMPVASSYEYIVYDVSNPREPRRVSTLQSDSSFQPHWIARDPGSDRLVMTAEGARPAVRLARFDTTSGAIRWDERFRERAGGPLGVSFERTDWPGGGRGRAVPHGALFSRR